jgi:hypothetical protein
MASRTFAFLALAQSCLGQLNPSNKPAVGSCSGKVVQFRIMRDSKKCLDVRGGQITDGAQLEIWDCNGRTNQDFVWCSDGRIVSAGPGSALGMCLDVPGGDPSKPNNLQLWQCNGGSGQYWQFDTTSQSIFPPSTGEKMCIDVAGGSDTNGADVNIYYCSPGSGEKWYIGQGAPPAPTPAPIPQCSGGKGEVQYFQLNRDTRKCLDIAGGKAVQGASVQVWNCNGQDNQKFIWCSDGRIVSRIDDNMCLDVPGGDPSKAEDLQIWPCNRADGQYWMYDGNTMSIYPYKTGEKMCMDVSGGATAPGTKVNVYGCTPGTGEKWQTNKATAERYINV